MTLIYPGVCDAGSSPDCRYGTTVNLAVPVRANPSNANEVTFVCLSAKLGCVAGCWQADPSDPLSRNFSKTFYKNPIMQVNAAAGPGGGGPAGGGGDSSAAWKTASGEWRIITRDKEWSNVWASDDFRQWDHIGPQPGFTQGACPSFCERPRPSVRRVECCSEGLALLLRTVPLPAPTGESASASTPATPNSVYMYSKTTLPPPASHRTVLVVGDYQDQGRRVLAKFTPTHPESPFQIADNGTYCELASAA